MGNGTRQARRLPRDAPRPVTWPSWPYGADQGLSRRQRCGAVPGADGRPQAAMPSHPKRSRGCQGLASAFTWLMSASPGAKSCGASAPGRIAVDGMALANQGWPALPLRSGLPRCHRKADHEATPCHGMLAMSAAPARRVRSVPAAASQAIGLAERGPDRSAGRSRVVNPPTSHGTGMMELTL